MGISTIQSYRGAQIFEAIGLNQEFIDKYFTWTPSRIGGIGIDVIADEVKARHHHAFPNDRSTARRSTPGGQYQWRKDGEYHLFNPETVHKLQYACRTNNYKVFQGVQRAGQRPVAERCTLRGLMELQARRQADPDRGSRTGRERS